MASFNWGSRSMGFAPARLEIAIEPAHDFRFAAIKRAILRVNGGKTSSSAGGKV